MEWNNRMKTVQQFVVEMAMDKGSGYSFLTNSGNTRKSEYMAHNMDTHVNHPIVNNKNIELQKTTKELNGNTTTQYHTNDHNKKETLHRSIIIHHEPTEKLPFKHEEQSEVDRLNGGDLPNGYARDVTYNHFKNSEYPLRSSDEQFAPGHNMWKRLTNKALNDGHHVYFHDGNKLTKSNKENIDNHLESSFGKGEEYANKHMIISKKELDT